jgi:hypothetical protein
MHDCSARNKELFEKVFDSIVQEMMDSIYLYSDSYLKSKLGSYISGENLIKKTYGENYDLETLIWNRMDEVIEDDEDEEFFENDTLLEEDEVKCMIKSIKKLNFEVVDDELGGNSYYDNLLPPSKTVKTNLHLIQKL